MQQTYVTQTVTATPGSIIARLLWSILSIIEIILAFRFVLQLIQANPESPFVNFVYVISAPLIQPFGGIVANQQINTATLEYTTLIAMFVYWVVAWIVTHVITAATDRPTVQVVQAKVEPTPVPQDPTKPLV